MISECLMLIMLKNTQLFQKKNVNSHFDSVDLYIKNL